LEDQEGSRGAHHESFWTAVQEMSSQMVCRVTKNDELDLVEGSAPSEMEKRDGILSESRIWGSPATTEVISPTGKKESE
jgi:hypothetical protein